METTFGAKARQAAGMAFFVLATIFAASFAVILSGDAEATGSHVPTPPACPFDAADHDVVVDWTNGGSADRDDIAIRSDTTNGDARLDPESVHLNAGKYTIHTFSWDGYKDRINISQPDESWTVVVEDGNGGHLYTSGATTDIPDNVLEDSTSNTFNTMTLAADVDADVIAVHAKSPKTASPNSVVPICVAFDLEDVVVEPDPWCEMKVNGKDEITITRGDSATITWDSDHVSTVDIDNNIGSVADNGSQSVSPSSDTRYIGKFLGDNGKEIECDVKIFVKEPPVKHGPVCALDVSPSRVSRGDSVTITWTSDHVSDVDIDQGIGSVAVDGSKTVTVNSDTTYTGTFLGDNGDTITCKDTVTIKTGGGGGPCLNCGDDDDDDDDDDDRGDDDDDDDDDTPNITLSKDHIDGPTSGISLDQVPYTGFEAGPVLTVLFWLGVFGLSALIAYVLTIKRPLQHALGNRGTEPQHQNFATYEHDLRAAFESINITRTPTYQADDTVTAFADTNSRGADNSEEQIEARAHSESILLSPEALRAVVSELERRNDNLEAFTDRLFEEAKGQYVREDGWILLSKERVGALLGSASGNSVGNPTDGAAQKTAPQITSRTIETRRNSGDALRTVEESVVRESRQESNLASRAVSSDESSQYEGTVSTVTTFITWLAGNEQQKVYNFVRKLSSQGYSVDNFISQVVRALDEVYKHRLEGNRKPDASLAEKTATWSNGDLEAILGILVESVDFSYSSSRIGTKIALANVFEYFAKKNSDQSAR